MEISLLDNLLDLDPSLYQGARKKLLQNYPTTFEPFKDLFFKESQKKKPNILFIHRFLECFSQGGIDQNLFDFLLKSIHNSPLVQSETYSSLFSHPQTLSRVISALGQWEGPEAIPSLLPFLGHFDPRIRSNVIELIGEVGNGLEFKETVRPFLEDPHHRVRTAALMALWNFGEFGILEITKEMLKDPDHLVQRSAQFALGKMALSGIEEGRHPLSGYLKMFFNPLGSNPAKKLREEGGSPLDREQLFSLGLFISRKF